MNKTMSQWSTVNSVDANNNYQNKVTSEYSFDLLARTRVHGDARTVAQAVISYVNNNYNNKMFSLRDISILRNNQIVSVIPGELYGFLVSDTEGGASLVELLDDGSLCPEDTLTVWTGVVRTYAPVCDDGNIDKYAEWIDSCEEYAREGEAYVQIDKKARDNGFVLVEKNVYVKDGKRYQMLTWSDVSTGRATFRPL